MLTTKQQVLAMLESGGGQSVSGSFIAKRLGLSRNAVWKAVNGLKKDGYVIEAVTNKGYRLGSGNDILSVQGMLPFLSGSVQAERIHVYASLQSTNITAKSMAVSGAEHGTAVIADHQTGGRGRHGRPFYSPAGHGIYMSLILHPSVLRLELPSLITTCAAVAVCEAIEAVSDKRPQIKWVNDIILDGKKICGISTEAVTDLESGGISWIVLGIGVNFNTPEEHFPEELRQIAGSVFSKKTNVTRNRLIAEILNRLLAPEIPVETHELLLRYKSRMTMLGKRVTVYEKNESYPAEALDVDCAGRLVILTQEGETRMLAAGEISVRNRP